MDNVFKYTDRAEQTLENMLIWWSTREPWVHADNCSGEFFHCCEGKFPEKLYRYGLEGSTPPWNEIRVQFIDNVQGIKTLMKPGDEIHYLGDYEYKLVRNGSNS